MHFSSACINTCINMITPTWCERWDMVLVRGTEFCKQGGKQIAC